MEICIPHEQLGVHWDSQAPRFGESGSHEQWVGEVTNSWRMQRVLLNDSLHPTRPKWTPQLKGTEG